MKPCPCYNQQVPDDYVCPCKSAHDAEEVGDELRREVQRLRDALTRIAHIGDPVLGTGVSPRAQEIARCALGWPAT